MKEYHRFNFLYNFRPKTLFDKKTNPKSQVNSHLIFSGNAPKMEYSCICGAVYAASDVAKFMQHLQECSARIQAQSDHLATQAKRGKELRIRERVEAKGKVVERSGTERLADAIRSAMQTFGGVRVLAPRDMIAREGFICNQCDNSFSSTDALFQHFGSCIEIRKSYEASAASRARNAKVKTPISQLPREMIGKIFSYLENPDIVNCAKTCKEWENIASQLYFQHFLIRLSNYDRKERYELREYDWSKDCSDSKLISALFEGTIIDYYGRVLTVNKYSETAEVIDLLDPKFNQKISFGVNENFLEGRYKWVNGFLMGDKILLHGFNYLDNSDFLCFLGQSKLGIKLNTYGREDASGIVKLNDFILLRVGGGSQSKAVELIYLEDSETNPFRFEEGPEFPHEIYGHAMIPYLPGKVHVTGGRIFDNTNWKATSETWIIDYVNHTITSGRSLVSERSHHSIGEMDVYSDFGHTIVAGGSSEDTASPSLEERRANERTAEFCKIEGMWEGWWEMIYRFDYDKHEQIVQKLDREDNWDNPDELMDAYDYDFLEEPIIEVPMINTPDGMGVILVGVGDEKSKLKELRRYDSFEPLQNNDYQEWINLEQHLKFTKGTQVAIGIPYGFRLSTIEGKGASDQGTNH